MPEEVNDYLHGLLKNQSFTEQELHEMYGYCAICNGHPSWGLHIYANTQKGKYKQQIITTLWLCDECWEEKEKITSKIWLRKIKEGGA